MVGFTSRAKLTQLLQSNQGIKTVQADLRGWAPSSGTGWTPTQISPQQSQRSRASLARPASTTWAANSQSQPASQSRPASVAGSARQQPATASGGLKSRRFSASGPPSLRSIGSRQRGTPSVAWDRPSSRATGSRPASRGFGQQNSRPASQQTDNLATMMCHHNMDKNACPNCNGREKTPLQPHHVTAFFDEHPQINPKACASIAKNMQERLYCRFKNTKQAFRYFDGAGAGAVHYTGFKSAMAKLHLIDARDEDQMRAMFNLCDQDGDGMITYLEFCTWIKTPDKHENLMVRREDAYEGIVGGMSYKERCNWIRRFGVMCE